MIFPLVGLNPVVKLADIDFPVAHVINLISIRMSGIKELGDRVDIISISFLNKSICWKTHRNYSIRDICQV